MIPICQQMNVALIPYRPLAGGHLARKTWAGTSLHAKTDRVAMGKYDHMEAHDMAVVERVHALAEKYAVTPSQIALAWQWMKGVTAPIIGATKAKYLEEAAEAIWVKLIAEDVACLEEP